MQLYRFLDGYKDILIIDKILGEAADNFNRVAWRYIAWDISKTNLTGSLLIEGREHDNETYSVGVTELKELPFALQTLIEAIINELSGMDQLIAIRENFYLKYQSSYPHERIKYIVAIRFAKYPGKPKEYK